MQENKEETIKFTLYPKPKKDYTAKDFLMIHGIEMNATSLIVYMDGRMVQPDLLRLMEEYVNFKNQNQ